MCSISGQISGGNDTRQGRSSSFAMPTTVCSGSSVEARRKRRAGILQLLRGTWEHLPADELSQGDLPDVAADAPSPQPAPSFVLDALRATGEALHTALPHPSSVS